MKILRTILAISLLATLTIAFLAPLISSAMQDYWKTKMGEVAGTQDGDKKGAEFLAKKNFWARFPEEIGLPKLALLFLILLIVVCVFIWIKKFFSGDK